MPGAGSRSGYSGSVDALTVVIADDHRLTAHGLTDSLSSKQVSVLATVHGVKAAADAVAEHTPDVLLTDLDMGPGPNGIDLALSLRADYPGMGVVVLTAFEDPKLLAANLSRVPKTFVYLVKQQVDEVGEIRSACELARGYARGTVPLPTRETRFVLSSAQAELLRLLASGLSNSAIARQLNLTEDSVSKSVNRLAKRLGVRRDEYTNVRVALTQSYFDMVGYQREV